MTTFPRSLARAPAFTAVRDGLMWLLDPNAGLRLRAKLAYAIGRATIAIAESPDDFRGLRAKRMTQPGLCIEAVNRGRAAVTLMEVGLTRGEDGPQIALREPFLHDDGPWPRTLEPGEAVVCHFGSGLAGHPVLREVRRAYAVTADGRVLYGNADALEYYLART